MYELSSGGGHFVEHQRDGGHFVEHQRDASQRAQRVFLAPRYIYLQAGRYRNPVCVSVSLGTSSPQYSYPVGTISGPR